MHHHEAAMFAQRRVEVHEAPPSTPVSTKPSLTSSMNRGVFCDVMLSLLAVSICAGGAIYLASTHGTHGFAAVASFIFVDDDDGLSRQDNFANMEYFGRLRENHIMPWLARVHYRERSPQSAHLMLELIAASLTTRTSSEGVCVDNVVEFMTEDFGTNITWWTEGR